MTGAPMVRKTCPSCGLHKKASCFEVGEVLCTACARKAVGIVHHPVKRALRMSMSEMCVVFRDAWAAANSAKGTPGDTRRKRKGKKARA